MNTCVFSAEFYQNKRNGLFFVLKEYGREGQLVLDIIRNSNKLDSGRLRNVIKHHYSYLDPVNHQ